MEITRFFVEDVRCLAKRQEFEIRPLTFLVGENSTGKTTALGCFQVLANLLGRSHYGIDDSALDFNVDPYSMGSFSDIVTKRRPKCKKFKLGFAFGSGAIQEIIMTMTEKKQSAEPVLECINIKFKHGELHITTESAGYTTPGNKEFFVIDVQKTDIKNKIFYMTCDSRFVPGLLFDYLIHGFGREDQNNGSREERALAEFLQAEFSENKARGNKDMIVRDLYIGLLRSFSFAPVRSRPKRTYDPTREFEDPEGSDIPMFLMNTKLFKKSQWDVLHEQLNKFGQSSGLFEKIEIKRHGRSMSDPFQIQVKVRGPQSNIIDVGYGVSQILPVLVRILRSQVPGIFLLQQPEVHLHPKAQAELTSLFITLANQKKHSFIIETHSDYMAGRARIEIQKGNISPEDVSLIYMEPKGSHVTVHNIGFDKHANLSGVPKNYREFFLKEIDDLLGFGE